MAYYYVKNGGTATGDAGRSATKRTGSFAAMGAAAYYDSIYDVFAGLVPTTAPAPGDFVLCSSVHDKTLASLAIGATTDTYLLSVDDSNSDQYLRGAWERGITYEIFTGGDGANFFTKGVSFEFPSYCNIGLGSKFFEDCEIKLIGVNKGVNANYDGLVLTLRDVTLSSTSSSFFKIGYGGLVQAVNSSFTLTATSVLFTAVGSGGSNVLLDNCDLSAITTSLITSLAGSSDNVSARLNRCKMPVGFVGTTDADITALRPDGIEMLSCDSGDSYFSIRTERDVGLINDETAIYRTVGATYDGANNFSAEFISNADTQPYHPLKFELSNLYIDTSLYTTDITFTVHFAVDGSTTALNSDEFWMEVEYADGADNALGVLADTQAAPLATGVAPTNETALWTGLSGTNKQMSISKTISIGTAAGEIASGIVRVNVYLGKASQTVFVCPKVEIS